MPIATVDDLHAAQRVLCYGVTGVGKTTAARELGGRLGLPVHLVDDEVGWLPGWTQRPVPEQREIAARLVSGDRWVLDSAYGHWRDLALPRTQVVLALDLPRWLSLARLLRRSLHRVLTREEQCNGNVETWRQLLSGDSILRWHFRSFDNKRQRMRAMEAAPRRTAGAAGAQCARAPRGAGSTRVRPIRRRDCSTYGHRDILNVS